MSTQHDSEDRRASAPPRTRRGGGHPGAAAPRSRAGTPRTRAAMAGGVALGLVGAALAGMPAQAINTNPPTGPGNIEVFPKRDMVAIEGYAEYAGKQATIEVIRAGAVVGSAVGTVDATGFLETNHPGGVCWGAGTSLKVTPDIRGDDEIRVTFAGGDFDGSRVSDVEVTRVDRDDATRTLTIHGRYGPGVDMPGPDLVTDPGKFGVEIVNPDMRGPSSGIGERAIGWPTDEPPTGHSVRGTVTGTDAAGGTFAVTYGFGSVEDLDLADSGEVVALAWLDEPDPATGIEAQYGITLNEFYEHGGPGMGGCPAGPQEVRPTAPGTYRGQGAGPGSIAVTWAAGTATPDSPPITGYTVRAVRGEDEVGKRLGADARSTTLTGLAAGEIYSVEIAPVSDAGEGRPAVLSRIAAADHVPPAAVARTARVPDPDGVYAPLVREGEVDYGVYLDPVPGVLGAEVHYTLDGSAPTVTSRTLPLGTSLQLESDTTVRWLVVDSGNIVGDPASATFDVVESAETAPAITGVAVAGVSGALDVTFDRLATADAYRLQTLDAAGARVGAPIDVAQPADGTSVTHRVTGLTDGTPYAFTVAARFAGVWTPESAPSQPVAPARPASVDAGPDQTVLRNRVVTLDGTASYGATAYSWAQVRPADGTGDPAVTLSDPAAARPTFTFPKKTSPTSDDGSFQFTLTATYADGSTRTDTVDVKEQRDVVAVAEARWRAGKPLRLNGTGTQNGAVLTFRDITASGPGTTIGTATVANGQWTAPSVTVNLSTGRISIWSDHGFVGEIQTTR